MTKPYVCVLYGQGINCDWETKHAFEQVGVPEERVQRVHVSELTDGYRKLGEFQIFSIPGGFSHGDYGGAGAVLGVELTYKLRDDLLKFIEDGKLIIGTCNGFQVMTRSGILPATDRDYTKQTATLSKNDSGRFINTWVYLEVNPNSPCVFTKGVEGLYLPIRHGEGKFVAPEEVLDQMERQGQVVLRYKEGSNHNGSMRDIAAVCDPTGRVFGLMPHPEAFMIKELHPRWTREEVDMRQSGIQIYRNMAEYFG